MPFCVSVMYKRYLLPQFWFDLNFKGIPMDLLSPGGCNKTICEVIGQEPFFFIIIEDPFLNSTYPYPKVEHMGAVGTQICKLKKINSNELKWTN